jgi:endonuclease YncB( thermonuclease family)
MAALFGPYPAKCIAIHDGDTATFEIDLGFDHMIMGLGWDGKSRLSCRVYGINAPELSTQAGKDALAYAETILHVGDVCQVTSHGWDKYGGRFDGTITLPDGTDYATLMLDSGHAVVMTA